MNPNDNLNHLSIGAPSPTEKLIIDTPGNVSLAEPNPDAALHVVTAKSPTEVARIFPIYQSLSDEKKLSFLRNLSEWCAAEIAGLTPLRIEDAKLIGGHGIGIDTTNLEFVLLNIKCNGCGNELVVRGDSWRIDFRGVTIFECRKCGESFTLDPSLLFSSDGNVGINT